MPPESADWLLPDWPAAVPGVRALMSTRRSGSLRLDSSDPLVADRRRRFAEQLGAEPVWMHQVHGAQVLCLDATSTTADLVADASISSTPGVACAVFAADCLPVLLCTDDGAAVGAAHAGWRGLAAGVLRRTVDALCHHAGQPPGAVQAWLGPCIGPRQFEVGADVLEAFGADSGAASDPAFVRRDRADGQARWLADLPALARRQLQAAGVLHIAGGRWCTVEDASDFFSFRRGDRLGRMGAAVACVGR